MVLKQSPAPYSLAAPPPAMPRQYQTRQSLPSQEKYRRGDELFQHVEASQRHSEPQVGGSVPL